MVFNTAGFSREAPQSAQLSVPVSHSLCGWCLVWVLFGAQASGSVDRGAGYTLGLMVLGPLAAAWAVQHFGPRVIGPLLLLTLGPSITWTVMPALSLGVVSMPLSSAVLGIGAGALWAARREPALWQPLVRRGREWRLVAAMSLLWIGGLEWPALRVTGIGFGLSFNLVGGVATLLLASIVDWGAVAGHTLAGRSARGGVAIRFWRFGLPALLIAATTVRPAVHVVPMTLVWGSTWMFAWVPVLGLLGVLAGAGRRRVWAFGLGLVLLLEVLRIASGLPPIAQLFRETRLLAFPYALYELCAHACDVAAAALLGWALLPYFERSGLEASRRIWLALGAIVLLQFGIAPFAESGHTTFFALTPAGWIAGGAGFAAALVRGGRALVVAPLVLVTAFLVAPVVSTGEVETLEVLFNATALATVAAMAAFMGWCVRRSAVALGRSERKGPLEIDRLAHFVQRLDTSATLRSFGALLAVIGVAWALVRMGVFAAIFQLSPGSDMEDVPELAVALTLAALLALAPLGFIGADAIQRQDRWRPLATLSGAVLAGLALAVGAVVLAALVVLPLEAHGREAATLSTLAGVVAVFTLLVALLATANPRAMAVLGALFLASGLGAIGAIAFQVLAQEGAETRAGSAGTSMDLQILAAMATVALALPFVARAVRLRADLSGPVPRGLLFGEIDGRNFWPRLACLMGLPASMWRLSALRTLSFWAFLCARPLVYAGVFWLWQGEVWIGALAVAAGHGLFVAGKCLAARAIWRLGVDDAAPVLFLRSFEDDQFNFNGSAWNPLRRWLALWSFRRNLDETLVDEVARYGRVVALGRPGETRIPFGSERYYSTHDDWQRVITETARRAHSIVIVAGDTPGVRWEYALLAREGLLDRTLLIFRPGVDAQAGNRAALAAFPLDEAVRSGLEGSLTLPLVALLWLRDRPILLTALTPGPAAYVLALRVHFQRLDTESLTRAARAAPVPLGLELRGWWRSFRGLA